MKMLISSLFDVRKAANDPFPTISEDLLDSFHTRFNKRGADCGRQRNVPQQFQKIRDGQD